MAFPLAPKLACSFCPIGEASHVNQGGQCPMVDRRRQAGATLYLAGTPAQSVYFVKHGSVALSRGATEKGEGAPHAIRRAGSMIGLEAVVNETYLDSARAVTDVTLCGVSREQMLSWLTQMGTARVVLESVLQTARGDNPARATTDGSAPQRVARWLLDGAKQKRLPRSVLAGLLGMKPETLSRALAALARAGGITLTRTSIEVADPVRLEQIADGAARA